MAQQARPRVTPAMVRVAAVAPAVATAVASAPRTPRPGRTRRRPHPLLLIPAA
ncbi:hypothetical protein [Streptomyces sp. NRRL S-118]|uniref:hypothetical protein n=1 Tax=Streptomyces sp. NRRL S-118 TaxID=1463881 RepID=UPI000AEBAFEF|nr:hypothetical protein [Streptomyces sp. NRRL S-118]